MGTQYLIDSNAVTDFLSGKFSENGMSFLGKIIDLTPNISVITRIEILSFITQNSRLLNKFVEISNVIALDEEIIQKTIALRRSRKIKIPDAIIASTAIVKGYTLVTHNISDFEGIPSLKFIDIYSII